MYKLKNLYIIYIYKHTHKTITIKTVNIPINLKSFLIPLLNQFPSFPRSCQSAFSHHTLVCMF